MSVGRSAGRCGFSGKLPSYFADTLQQTSHDEKRWGQFWAGRGLAKHEIAFIAAPGDEDTKDRAIEVITGATKALGITLFKVDEIMHGMQLGSAGMINQVEQWAKTPALQTLLAALLNHGFTVALTADHGNTEANGIGAPQQSEQRGGNSVGHRRDG